MLCSYKIDLKLSTLTSGFDTHLTFDSHLCICYPQWHLLPLSTVCCCLGPASNCTPDLHNKTKGLSYNSSPVVKGNTRSTAKVQNYSFFISFLNLVECRIFVRRIFWLMYFFLGGGH